MKTSSKEGQTTIRVRNYGRRCSEWMCESTLATLVMDQSSMNGETVKILYPFIQKQKVRNQVCVIDDSSCPMNVY